MNPLKLFCLVACLVAAASARPGSKRSGVNPANWFSASDLESMQSLDQISLSQLDEMPLQEGAELTDKLFHLIEMNHNLKPNFEPSPRNIPVHIISNRRNTSTNLKDLVSTAESVPNFGKQEVTVFITGLPSTIETVAKANEKLVNAYVERYTNQPQQSQLSWNNNNNNNNRVRTESEEDSKELQNAPSRSRGDLIVIDLGATLKNLEHVALLKIEKTGQMIAHKLVELNEKTNTPNDVYHVIGQGVGAHVAGAVGRQVTRLTGQELPRITALDPSKIYAQALEYILTLGPGDAQFVDGVHTSCYALGTRQIVGDVDFFPNGPNYGVPGAKSVIEAMVRATRYFAESVRPNQEHNFPAVRARSLEEYNNQDGYGKRAYMGILAKPTLKGAYILEVNSKSPFGKSASAQKQNGYHGANQSWRKSSNNNQMDY